MIGSKPADSCPFRRPFQAQFDACPGFVPVEFVALNMMNEQLPAVQSCRHLVIGSLPGQMGAYYPRCALGDAEARQHWVDTIHAGRLRKIRLIQAEFAEALRPHLQRMRAAKVRQLGTRHPATSGHPYPATATSAIDHELREAAEAFSATSDRFLEERADRLWEVGLPADACQALIKAALRHWMTGEFSGADFDIPQAILALFPPELHIFFQPQSPDLSAGATA